MTDQLPDGVRILSRWTVLPDDPLGLRTWLRAQATEQNESERADEDEKRVQRTIERTPKGG